MNANTVAVAVLLIILVGPGWCPSAGSAPRVSQRGAALPALIPGPSQPSQGQYLLYRDQYNFFGVNSYGTTTRLEFSISATYQIDAYVMTSPQYSDFAAGTSTAAVCHWKIASGSESCALPAAGRYFLVVWNDVSGRLTTFDLSYTSVPVDIYQLYTATPAPIGIADYGVQNSSDSLLPYEEAASRVTGSLVLNSLSAYDSSPPIGSDSYGAGLQLNVMLRVNTTAGQFVYWLQNTLTMYTGNRSADFISNIWNATTATSQIDSTRISPASNVYPSSYGDFYANGSPLSQYATPLAAKMSISVSHAGDSVTIMFGNKEAQGGSPLGSKFTYYDNATISEPVPVQDAAIVISGYSMTPDGRYFDSELVFVGDCCGASTTFSRMDSTLNMYYTLVGGATAAPRSLYGFGSDTGEAASNVKTGAVQGGFQVGIGTPDFGANYIPPKVTLSSLVLSYSVGDGSTVPSPPRLDYLVMGDYVSAPLSTTPTAYQADPNSNWTVGPVTGTGEERWAAVGQTNGTFSGSHAINLVFRHQYMLTLNSPGGGSVSPTTGWYDAETTVQITASASPGWRFEGWAGSGPGSYSGPQNSTSVLPGGAVAENATFYPGVTITAGDGGSVSYSFGSVSGTVSPGSTETVFVPPGTRVTLKAAATSLLYTFTGWSGAVGGRNQVQEAFSSPASVSANFSNNLAVLGLVGVVILAVALAGALVLRHSRRRARPAAESPAVPPIPQDAGAQGPALS